MDVETKIVLERLKRCVSRAGLDAVNIQDSANVQRLEEIGALVEMLERKIK